MQKPFHCDVKILPPIVLPFLLLQTTLIRFKRQSLDLRKYFLKLGRISNKSDTNPEVDIINVLGKKGLDGISLTPSVGKRDIIQLKVTNHENDQEA